MSRDLSTTDDLRLLQDEASFQRQVITLAELYGWLVFHDTDSRRNHAGFPDLVMTKGGRLIFAELKTVKGRVRTEQARWLGYLGAVPGITVALWRPTDWPEIERLLTTTESINESLLTTYRGDTRTAGSVVTAPARHRTGGSNA